MRGEGKVHFEVNLPCGSERIMGQVIHILWHFLYVKRNILVQSTKNVASWFSVLSRHHKQVYRVKVQKELMQFACSACLISYFMGF